MKRAVLTCGAILVALVLTACGSSSSDGGGGKGTVRVGLMTDLSGRFVSFGKDLETSTKLAVRKVNDSGGVNGAKLALDVVDTGGQPDQAVAAYRELQRKGVVAISGPLSSGEGEVLFRQAPQAKLVLMSGTANQEGITDPGKGWALRNTATNTALYEKAMPVWQKKYSVKTAVLALDEQEPVSAAAAKLAIPKVAKQLGISIVDADKPITFRTGQSDFSTTVQKLRQNKADALIIMSAPTEAGLLARELARQGDKRPVLGHPSQGSNSFFEAGGKSINDWVLPSIFNPARDNPATQAYVAAMKKLDKDPPTVPESANYYDNIMMFAEVMKQQKIDAKTSTDKARSIMKDGLLGLRGYEGVAGTITFGGTPDAKKTVYVNVVRDGKLEPLATQ